jgi:hypothetical protein
VEGGSPPNRLKKKIGNQNHQNVLDFIFRIPNFKQNFV